MRGEERRQKDTYGNRTPQQKAPARQRRKRRDKPTTKTKDESKSTGEEEKGEEEEDERTDAVQPAEQERQTRG